MDAKFQFPNGCRILIPELVPYLLPNRPGTIPEWRRLCRICIGPDILPTKCRVQKFHNAVERTISPVNVRIAYRAYRVSLEC